MMGCVYMFESEGPQTSATGTTISTAASRAIEAGINERPGIRYQELTDPSNPKPVFAVLFADPAQKEVFETLFERALKLCDLRVSVVQEPTTDSAAPALPGTAHKADLGYIDHERGYAIFIPSLARPIKDPSG